VALLLVPEFAFAMDVDEVLVFHGRLARCEFHLSVALFSSRVESQSSQRTTQARSKPVKTTSSGDDGRC